MAGKYTIRSMLGFTGEVATYRAATNAGQEVVIKLFNPAVGQRADIMSQLERVRGQVAQLGHDAAVPVIDAGYDVGTSAPFSVTEYLQTPSLARLVATGPLSSDVVGALMMGLARFFDAVHAGGFHHLALKPTNVFVGAAPGYQVRVTDFEASIVRSTSPTHEAYAQSAPWWAPEQLQPAAVLGPATDVFASALLAFYALTGRSYWLSCQTAPPDLPAWQMEVMGQRVPVSERANALGATVNPMIDGVFARAMSINQPERPSSVLELANVLAAASGYGQSGGDVAKTMAFPEEAGAAYPPAPQGSYASPAGFGGGAPGTAAGGGQYTATGGQPGGGSEAQPVTPGLPPFPHPTKKKSRDKLVPVVIGVTAAVAVVIGVVAMLFFTSDDEDGVAASATATSDSAPEGSDSAEPVSSVDGEGGGEAVTDNDGDDEDTVATVSAVLKCKPECDELYVDNEKVEDPNATLQLIPGKHTVKALKKGYYPRTDTISIPSDKPFEKEYVLAPIGVKKPRPKPCGQFLKPCK